MFEALIVFSLPLHRPPNAPRLSSQIEGRKIEAKEDAFSAGCGTPEPRLRAWKAAAEVPRPVVEENSPGPRVIEQRQLPILRDPGEEYEH